MWAGSRKGGVVEMEGVGGWGGEYGKGQTQGKGGCLALKEGSNCLPAAQGQQIITSVGS